MVELAVGRQWESSRHWESGAGGNGSDPCCALRAAVPAQVKVGLVMQLFTGISTTSRAGLLKGKQQPVSRKPGRLLLWGRGRAQAMATVGDHPCFSLSWPRAFLTRGRKAVSCQQGRYKLQ